MMVRGFEIVAANARNLTKIPLKRPSPLLLLPMCVTQTGLRNAKLAIQLRYTSLRKQIHLCRINRFVVASFDDCR